MEFSPRVRMRQLARTEVVSQGTKLKVRWAVEAWGQGVHLWKRLFQVVWYDPLNGRWRQTANWWDFHIVVKHEKLIQNEGTPEQVWFLEHGVRVARPPAHAGAGEKCPSFADILYKTRFAQRLVGASPILRQWFWGPLGLNCRGYVQGLAYQRQGEKLGPPFVSKSNWPRSATRHRPRVSVGHHKKSSSLLDSVGCRGGSSTRRSSIVMENSSERISAAIPAKKEPTIQKDNGKPEGRRSR